MYGTIYGYIEVNESSAWLLIFFLPCVAVKAYGKYGYTRNGYLFPFLLPLFQIIGCFCFSKYVVFATCLDIMYI
jgi:hypothetical protein